MKPKKWSLKTNREYITPFHIVLECISFACLIACFVLAVIAMRTFPDTIPTHFTIDGTPDGYGSPSSMLALPLIITPVMVLLSLIAHFVPAQYWNMPFRVSSSPEIARAVYRKILTLEYLIQAEISIFTLLSQIQSFRLSGKGVLLGCGLLMIAIIISIAVPVVQAYHINQEKP